MSCASTGAADGVDWAIGKRLEKRRVVRSFLYSVRQSSLYGEFGSFSWRISSTGSCFSQPA